MREEQTSKTGQENCPKKRSERELVLQTERTAKSQQLKQYASEQRVRHARRITDSETCAHFISNNRAVSSQQR